MAAVEHELESWNGAIARTRAAARGLQAALARYENERRAELERRRRNARPRPEPRPVASVRRRLAINFATVVITSIMLATIVGTAYSLETRQGDMALPAHRLIGVTTDPWHSDEWSKAVGGDIDIVANFMAWGYGKSPRERFAEARRRKLIPMVTWEPWTPRQGRGGGAAQPRFSNRAIADGRQDAYIRSFARDAARFKGPVLLRFAHEMNGHWYPWHRDPKAYVAAWRHVHRIFREEGATNVVFIWAPNLPHGSYALSAWKRDIRVYWPGADYVDWVGTTTIGRNGKSVAFYARRVETLRSYRKPIILAETYAVHSMRDAWLEDLRAWVARSPWIRAVVWSEGERARSLRVDHRRHAFGRMIHDAKGR
jgi:hypothetical protein